MATFSELIKGKYVKPAFLRKQAAVADIERHIQAIDGLDTEVPNARSFNRVEVAAKESLEELKGAIKDLDILLYDSQPDIRTDEDYKADQILVRDVQFKLYKAIDDYIDLLTAKKIQYPPDMPQAPAPNPGDLADVLAQLAQSQAQLVKCQTDNAKATAAQLAAHADQHKETINTLSKHGTSGPKAMQPFFSPKNNESDFQSFRDFMQRFDFFVARCTDAVKLQWLQTSVKGDAASLIKHLSLTDANYIVAK